MRNFFKILLRILPFLALLGFGFWIVLQFYGSREQESWFSSQYWGKENKAQRAAAQQFIQAYKDSLQRKNLSPTFLNWATNYSHDSLQISALEAEEKLHIQLLQRHIQAQTILPPSSVSFLQTPYYCPPDSIALLTIEKQWLRKNTPDSIRKCLQALPVCKKANAAEKNYFRQQLILLIGTDVQTELLFAVFQQELDSLYTQLAQLDSNSINANYWSQLQKQKEQLDSLPQWPLTNAHDLSFPPFILKNGKLGLQKIPQTIAWPVALLPLTQLLQKNNIQADSLPLSPFQALSYPNLLELKAENKAEEKAILFAQIWQTKLLLAELGWYDQNWDIKQLKDFLKQNSPLPNYFQEQLILYLRSWPSQLLRPKLQNEILKELAHKMAKNNQPLNTNTFLQQYAALPLDLWEEALDLK